MTMLALMMGAGDTYAGAERSGREARPAWPKIESAITRDPQVEARIERLLAQMTLEEKVGQLIQAEIKHVTPDDIRTYHLGSVLNGGGSFPDENKHAKPSDWLALADTLYEASMDTSDGGVAVPLIWGTDAVHGHGNVFGATLFPHNVGLGATRDPSLVKQIAAATAKEVTVTGIDWTFAPTLAVVQDDRWGRAYESFSEDPDLVAELGAAAVTGFQGDPALGAAFGPGRVVATAKHFLGDGGTEQGQDQGNTVIDERGLLDRHAPGYFAAIEAGTQTIMASYSSWNGVKMHGNHYLLTEVLKNQMGFDGFVIGDWNGHGQIPGCTDASCPAAINAGVDMIMVPTDWKAFYTNTLGQVRSGEIPAERLDEAVRRILRVKIRAGLFDKGKPSARPFAGQAGLLGHPDHRRIARQAVRESLVLLKNNGAVLPITPAKTILVAGDGADSIVKQTGGWTLTWQGTGNSNADFPGATSVYAAISAAAGEAGGQAILSPDGTFERRPDVAVVVFGEEPYAEMQGDMPNLDLTGSTHASLDLMRRLRDQDIPVVAVLLTGRALWVNPAINLADAFVVAWLPGSEGGGIADVLLAQPDGTIRYDFKGRLPVSWPRQADQGPINGAAADREALFPFGFGLTYQDRSELAPLPEDGGAAAMDDPSHIQLFRGRPVAPWAMFAGDGGAWTVPVYGGPIDPKGGQTLRIRAVSHMVQEDARQIAWPGGSPVHVYLKAQRALDLTALAEAGGVLSFDVRVEKPPLNGQVTLGMECGDNCGANVPIGTVLRHQPAGTWSEFSVALRCFAQAGVDLSDVIMPFQLTSDAEMTLSLANIKLTGGGESKPTVSCP